MASEARIVSLGRKLLVWAWVGVLSVGPVKTTKMPVGPATLCVPIEQQVVEVNYTLTSYSVASEIMCAALSIQKRALEYTFTGSSQWCVLGGEGSGEDSSTHTFVGVATPDMLQEVARGRDTYACPEWPSCIPAHGVDGDNTTLSHSAENLQYPWWLVDLGEIRLVHQVKILPRQGMYPERFNNVEIRVGVELETSGNFSSYRLFSFYNRVYTADQGTLSCYRRDAVAARYISLKRVTYGEFLQILEVEVFAFV